MISTLLFAFPAVLLSIILFFVSCNLIHSKISFSLLSGTLRKNSKKINKLCGLGYHIFILSSLIPSLFFFYIFKIEINIFVFGFVSFLILIFPNSIVKNTFFSFLLNTIISFLIIILLDFPSENTVDYIIIGVSFFSMMSLGFVLRKQLINENVLISLNSIFTFLICVLAIIFNDQKLFLIHLLVFNSSICLLIFNKLNKEHKILITPGGNVAVGFFIISSILYLFKLFFIN